MIIDSHLHLSYTGTRQKDFSKTIKALCLSMKKNKIDYSLIIPDNIPNTQCADLDTLIEIVKHYKQFFIVGTINIFKQIKADFDKLDKLLKAKKIHGIKLFPGHDPFYPTDKRCGQVYKLCLKFDLPIIFHTGINSGNESCAKYNDPKHIIKIAKKFPKLKIVIAHFFWPKMDYCFELTKDIDNIYYDTSAMADPEVVEASGGIKKVKLILEKIVKKKPDKILFGTDWPICSTKKHTALINNLNISAKSKNDIFCNNAVRLFKLNIREK